ncbi:MAG: hypothetical protein Q7O66_19880 [Dehalococcoidia bacterium]|nr:hypothetical protein [Dehalococcoidia bacterium]
MRAMTFTPDPSTHPAELDPDVALRVVHLRLRLLDGKHTRQELAGMIDALKGRRLNTEQLLMRQAIKHVLTDTTDAY